MEGVEKSMQQDDDIIDTSQPIVVPTDDLDILDISSRPLGTGRDDRGVVVTDSSGKSATTSSIMMGYNKQGIMLENGQYVSFEEFKESLITEMDSHGEDVVYICTKTGKEVSKDFIAKSLFEEAIQQGYLRLSPDSSIKNQTSARVEIVNLPNEKAYPKGVLMLGKKKGIELANGDYVSLQELLNALNNYVMITKKTEEENKKA